MKPASVVVLILAALLAVGGVAMCFVGNSVAKKDGMDLFTQERAGQPYLKQEFSAGKVSKIELIVKNATVNVSGGDITSYIEFINYNPNMYNLDVTSQAISFDEIEDLKSLFNIWENGFGFKGYRNLFNFSNIKSTHGEKVINVHLGDGSLISSVIIKGENINVNVQNAEIRKDLKIESKKASVEITDLAAGGSFILSSDEANVKASLVTCSSMTVNSQNAGIFASDSDIKGVDIKNAERTGDAEFEFNTKSGAITVDGDAVDGLLYSKRIGTEEVKYSYKIKTESAPIVYVNIGQIQPETEESESETVAGG